MTGQTLEHEDQILTATLTPWQAGFPYEEICYYKGIITIVSAG